jgi:hypothetical protein
MNSGSEGCWSASEVDEILFDYGLTGVYLLLIFISFDRSR